MVALDGSVASEYALRTTLHIMNKKVDELYLFSATEKLGGNLSSPAFFSTISETQKTLERDTDRLLKKYGKYAKDRGVRHFGIND
jgi:nucleotide-binding universal stress UspA family protein